MTDDRPVVHLFTDGACSGNPGPGGWAFILRHPDSGREKVGTGGHPETTNNRMELAAVIEGLRAVRAPSRVHLYSDSQYVVHGLGEWIDAWKKRGWTRKGNHPVLNAELWKELDRLRSIHSIESHWVRGHSDHPENVRCDHLATEQIEKFRRSPGRGGGRASRPRWRA